MGRGKSQNNPKTLVVVVMNSTFATGRSFAGMSTVFMFITFIRFDLFF